MASSPAWERLAVAAGALLLILAPASAAAEKAEKAADAAYAKAQRAFDAGDCPAAMTAFVEAYKLRPHPRALLHIGHCYRKLGDLDSAAGAYAMLVDRFEGSPLARRARDLLLVVEGERARAAKEGSGAQPTPSFQVPAWPELEKAPPFAREDAPAHPPAAPAEPEKPTAAAAQAAAKPLPAAPAPPAPVEEPPSVAASKPAAREEMPVRPPMADAPVVREKPPVTPPPAVDVTTESVQAPRGRVWTWVAAGTAVAALGGGALFAAQANSTKSSFENQEQSRAQKDALAKDYDQQKSRASMFLIAGGVLAAATGALFVLRF